MHAGENPRKFLRFSPNWRVAMPTDVAAFTKQLREDGVEGARQEAEKIISEAKRRAQQIIDEATSAAKELKHDAQEEITRKLQRSEAEMKLAARDLILIVKKKIEAVATGLLLEKVSTSLEAEEVIKMSIAEIIKQQKPGLAWELKTGKALAKSVVEDLFKKAGARVKLAEGLGKAGFELRQADSAEVIEVTDESVVAAFGRLLSPELCKVLDALLETKK